jgi:hypothetical protein
METTIIKLDGNPNDSSMVVRSATFEEAFGDFSEARGKGRARRQARKLDRQENKAERKVARQTTKQAKIGAKQETRQLRRGGRQEARIGRRATRKDLRQGIRAEQQADRMARRGARLDMRQQREDAKQMREDTRVQGDESRENYMAEQEAYRDSLQPQEEGQGGYAPQDDMGSAPQGGGGSQDDWGSAPSGYYDESEDQGGYEETPSEGAYGDDNTYEGDYIQEEDEFGDDSYFNVEGMDGKSIVTPYVKENAQKLKNNARAYSVLKAKRKNALSNNNETRGLENLMDRTRTRIVELKSNLDNYCNADGNPTEMKRRRKEVNLALGRRLRRRNRVNQYAGSEVPVETDLSPEFSPNRIEVPPTSSFDAYSDLGRPVIVDGQTMSDASDYSDDIIGDFEPTTIEMQSSFDGGNSNKNVVMSVAIGVGVGALALYLAKRQGWI